MAIRSMQDLVKERKYPFLLIFFILLIFVTFLLISNSQSPIYLPSSTDIVTATNTIQTQSNSEPLSPLDTSSSPPFSDTASSPPISDSLVIAAPPRNDEGVPINDSYTSTVDYGFDWKVCDGSVAVDYIPCLDNWKAIKALRSRRHMEHRERHCPKPTARCLVPLPLGYKVPVQWPKSRDMVR